MNRDRYRTVFCKRLGMLIAVAEIARAQGKGSGRKPGSGSRATPPAPGAASFVLATMSMLSGGAALAAPPLPTGGEVVSGSGWITQNGTTLTVNQSTQSLAANWQSFDIDAGHSVVFNQPNSSSVALNRVIGPEASSIYGNLTANGKVFLVNPNGVLFAPGAQVSTGGLVASTLKISDEDFAAGRYRFTDGSNAGSVVNEGSIDAGSVALIGPKVVNNGTISTPGGRTTFAAGDQVTVSLMDGLVTAQVDAAAAGAEILNHGQIIANGGQVHLLAGRADRVVDSLINTDGVIQANSVRSENGKIYLDAGAGGTAYVNGALDASAANEGNGGDVRVLGDRVTLDARATVDVSGEKAGGTVLIGGDYQGKNPETLNARFTAVESGAAIRADGAEQGGRVVVWADNATRFEGKITARGRGFTEVSGKGTLRFSGEVDTGGGTLLLDPPYITVQNTAGDQDSTFSGGQIATLLGSNDVVLNADIDITWNADAALDYNGIGSTTRTLTLQAGNTIAFNGSISDSVAGVERLNVVLNADRDANGVGGINIANGASILTSGGDVVLRGGNVALAPLPSFTDPNYSSALGATAAWGVALGTATLNAGGGNITMRGIGVGGTSNSSGISITGTTVQTSGSGTITLDGIGGAGLNNNRGILTLGAANISTADGALTLQGMGGGTGAENIGVRPNGGTIQTTGSGNLTVNSLGATGSDTNDGFVIDGAILRVNNGNLSITGTGRGTGVGSDGIELANSSLVEAIGTGSVTFNGSSTATGSNTNRGITVWLSSTVRTTDGALTLQGASANAANGDAISVEASGTIGDVSQSGAITLTGDTMNFASGSIRGSGSLLLQPLTPSATIGLGNGASGTLNLTSAEIGLLQNGFSSIGIGRSDSSGAVDVRTAAFLDPVTIRTPAGSGSIAVSGTLSTGIGTSSGDITLQAGGNIALSGGTINTATALDLTGSSYTVTGSSTLTSNTLAFGNTNDIDNTGTLTLNQASNTTVANNISGASGNLTKAGTNTLTLSGANTYGGTTTISAGTLQVGTGGTTGTLGTGAVTNSGTLTFNRSDTVSYSGVLSGSGSLTQAGSGTLVLTGDNTYNGTTTISAGTLQIGDGGTTGALGTGAVTDNGTLVFNRSDAMTAANAISGTGSVRKEGTGTVTLTGVNGYSGGTTINAGTLTGRGGGGNNVTISPFGSGSIAVAAGATAVVDNTPGSGYNRFNNEFTGAGTVSYRGSSVNRLISPATLSGFTGTVSIDQNVVQLWAANTTATLNVSSGATFSTWHAFSGLNVDPVFGALTGNGIVAGVSGGGGGTLSVGNGDGSGTFAGVISDANGQVSLTKIGTGTQTLTGSNTYSGTTTISGGTLQIGNGGTTGTLGSGAVTDNANLTFNRSDTITVANAIGGTGTVTQAGSGTTILSANNTYGGTTSVNAGTLQVGDGGNAGTLGSGAATVNAAGTLRWYRSNVNLDIPNSISGTGTLSFLGTGAFGNSDYILSGNNSGFTGPVIIDRARLRYDNANDLGIAAPITVLSGGQLWAMADIANSITLNGTGWDVSTGALFLQPGVNASGSITLQSDARIGASTTGTISGVISGAGNLAKSPTSGTLILTGNNTYTGTTTVMNGTLAITNAAALGSASGGTTIETSGTLDLRNVALGAETITLNGIGASAFLTASTGPSSFSGNLVLNGTHANGNAVGAGTGVELTLSGVISGSGTLTKPLNSGLGTVVLAGNNTYSGLTTVSTGTLAVTSASALGSTSGATRISQGGTLDLRNVALGAETITIDGGLGFATLTASTGPSSLAGNIILGGFNVASNRVAAAAGVELTLSGEISGARALAKTDAGTVILTGNNTYTGTTTVSAGTLQVGNDGTTGTLGAGAVTNNANLIFNRSDSTSLGTLAAGGISGTGNVTALIGGDFNVDRAIALSGASSSILLEAGKGVPGGTVAGGDVTLSSNVSTSATGTLTIFSGNATTGAYEAMVSGADGPMRYKTYGASAGNTAGAVTGTRNYYYRQQPSALTVSGLTATKVYDGLLDASAVLDSSGATINGALDGDTLSFGDFTLSGASFDSAHAGTRGLSASFSGTYAHTGSGNWSVSGADYALGNYFNATAGTITPKTISASINPVGKTYDGLTSTLATLSPTGFVGNDNASGVTGFLLAFDDPNAGTRNIVATGTTGALSGFSGAASGNGSGIGMGNEVAGLASDYAVAAPTPVSAVISRAPLTITANNDAKIITQGDAAGYNGASYSGFVNGESSADLTGTLSTTRSNSGTEAAGTYTGVLVPTGYTSGNYEITYTNGNFQILPAEQLLVRLQNVSTSYGTAANYVVTSAEYLDGSGATLRTLTQTAQNGNTYTFSDGLGGSITFTVVPTGAITSSAGHLSAGNYALSGTNANVTGSNFSSANYVGNQTVTPIGLTPVGGVSKVYDGTTSMTGITLALSGALTGDAIWGNPSGAFLSRNAGSNLAYDISNITLGGADAGNYYLTSGGFSGFDGIILPREITVGGIVAHNKVYDGTTAATLTTADATLNSVVAGDAVAFDATSFSALFANKHVGTGKAVTVTGLGLSGADAGNYTLLQPTGLTANITPAPLTVTAVTNRKTYDGTASASATPLVTNGMLMAGDRFTALSEQYESPRVGVGRTLNPLVAIEDGNGGANYAVTLVSNTMGEILPGIDLSQVGGTNTTAKLNASIGDHRRRRELDEEHLLPSVRVIATGLKLPEGMAATGYGDFGDFAN